jgi:hypothetical protein
MEAIDKRFVLIADNGDRLYPYKKEQKKTGRYGFALSFPGEQDRHGGGIYTDSIQEVIKHVVLDGWRVRAKTTNKPERQREGSFGLNKISIHNYEVSEEFEHLVKSAVFKPLHSHKYSSEQEKKLGSLPEQSPSVEGAVIDEITFQAIKTRRGQPEFRKALLLAYDGKCCITGSRVESVLEAAHIVPHTEETNYSVSNGLLLRADVHTLYDLNQVGVDSSGKVFVSENLKKSEYWVFQEKIIADNICPTMSANLAKRFELFSAMC